MLKIVWAGILVGALVGLAALRSGPAGISPSRVVFELLALAAILAFLCVSLRVLRFVRMAERLLRQLLAGDYQGRLDVSGRWNDEVTTLERLMNRLLDQLRDYDELRTNHVRVSNRTMGVIFSNVEEAILSIDPARGKVRLNPSACRFLGTEESDVTLEAMSHIRDNADFFELLTEVTQVSRTPMTGLVLLCLPARNVKKRVKVEMLPVKDKDETVQRVLVFLTGETPAAGRAEQPGGAAKPARS